MMGRSGRGAAGSLAMVVGMLLLIILAVAALALLFRPVFGGRSRATHESAGGPTTHDDRFANRNNPEAHYLSTGPEIALCRRGGQGPRAAPGEEEGGR